MKSIKYTTLFLLCVIQHHSLAFSPEFLKEKIHYYDTTSLNLTDWTGNYEKPHNTNYPLGGYLFRFNYQLGTNQYHFFRHEVSDWRIYSIQEDDYKFLCDIFRVKTYFFHYTDASSRLVIRVPYWYRDYDNLNTPAYGWKGYFTDYTFESDDTVTTNQVLWTDEMMNDFQQAGDKRYNIGDDETLIGLTNYFIPKIEKITLYEYLHDTNAPWRPLYIPAPTETTAYTDWAGRPMGFVLNIQNLDPADQEIIKKSLNFTPQQARQLLENILGHEIVITNFSEQVEEPPQTATVTNQHPETPTPLPSVAEPEPPDEIHGLTKRNWLSVLMIAGGSALVVMVLLYAFWPRGK